MATARDVANFFIYLAVNSDEDSITNLQLNKLMYFAQGHYLARTGKALFSEPIEAWKLGPVIPSVYKRYKGFGKMPIEDVDADFSHEVFNDSELDLLTDIAREYGKYSPSALVSITHQPDTPWSNTFVPDANAVIESDIILNYFSRPENRLRTFVEAMTDSGIPIVDKLPADWYDPDEDAEWESYL